MDKLDNPELISGDHLKLAAALLQANEPRGYEQLRQSIIAPFTPTNYPESEWTLRIALLLPPSPNMLESLVSGAEVVKQTFPTADEMRPNPPRVAQWSETLALLEYRRSNFAGAEMWCNRCQDQYLPRICTTSFVKAMSNWRAHEPWAAILHWTKGYDLIQAKSRQGLAISGPALEIFPGASAPDELEGSWYDWVIAGLLMRECTNRHS